MIDDVVITSLKKIPDERGAIFHMLRSDDYDFIKFGEIYFSMAYPGVIKGWHNHTKQTQMYCVVQGMIKLVLCDLRRSSNTYMRVEEIFIGDLNYCRVKIPPGVANGYKNIGVSPCILANCSDMPHEKDEMERINPFDNTLIDYNWSIRIE